MQQTSINSSTILTLLLIGPIPEPKGGVGIHIQRLGRLLEKDFRICYVDETRVIKPGLYNIRSKKLSPYLQLIRSADIVHIQSSLTVLRCFHLMVAKLLFRKRVLVTIHSIWGKSESEVRLIKLVLKLANKVIVVNSNIQERLGLVNSVVQPAFIPPDMDTEPELPGQVSRWLEKQRGLSRKIIAANAFRIEMYEGQDLYGIDLCLEMMRRLVNDERLQLSLVFIISSLDRAGSKLDEYLQLIKEWELEDHVLLTCTSLSFVRLIKQSDIVLRPTCTDGDALTIRETLYFGKPVIASDVVERPPNTIIFRNRDATDFREKVLSVISGNHPTTGNHETLNSYRDFYLDLYKKLMQ